MSYPDLEKLELKQPWETYAHVVRQPHSVHPRDSFSSPNRLADSSDFADSPSFKSPETKVQVQQNQIPYNHFGAETSFEQPPCWTLPWGQNARRFRDKPNLLDSAKALASVPGGAFPVHPDRETKFTPQLVDTLRRSRKSGVTKPSWLSADRTDVTPGEYWDPYLQTWRIYASPSSPKHPSSIDLTAGISAVCPRRQPKAASALHSYQHHDQDTEKPLRLNGCLASTSTDWGATTNISSGFEQRTTRNLKSRIEPEHAARIAALDLCKVNSCDARVRHFVDSPSHCSCPSSRDEVNLPRRDSGYWMFKEAREHHRGLEEKRTKDRKIREARRKLNKRLDQDILSLPAIGVVGFGTDDVDSEISGTMPLHRDLEIFNMRKRVEPPLLGADIVFPRCQSPEPARFDVTQGSDAIRQRMCYLTEQTLYGHEPKPEGLWSPCQLSSRGVGALHPCYPPLAATGRSPCKADSTGCGGLWGGSCLNNSRTSCSPPGPSGLLTPRFDSDLEPDVDSTTNDMRQLLIQQRIQNLPPSPPPSNSGLSTVHGLDDRIEHNVGAEAEKISESEFDDKFVTLVYNYLSLGYPAVGHMFDEELSKVTRVPIEELRRDDRRLGSRGYIRLGEDEKKPEGMCEQTCARWKALKMYIHEWARQHPKMTAGPSHIEGCWAGARKNSWAL